MSTVNPNKSQTLSPPTTTALACVGSCFAAVEDEKRFIAIQLISLPRVASICLLVFY